MTGRIAVVQIRFGISGRPAGMGGGRIGSHPNTVWHVWEACGVGGGRIGSRPKTVWHVWEPAGFGEAA